MKERPILYSAAMIPPVLDGTKTQTRRIMNPQPVKCGVGGCDDKHWIWKGHHTEWDAYDCYGGLFSQESPFKVGDHLWVREEHYRFGHWEVIPGVKTKGGRSKNKFVADSTDVRFDAPESFRKGRHNKDPLTPAWHKRLARFMPKSFSRITLEITNVRVERLNDISVADCLAEGISRVGKLVPDRGRYQHGEIVDFSLLWESINGKGSWAQNQWVWVIEFKKL